MPQPSNLPLDELVRGPDDQSAQQIKSGIHEGSYEREGGGREGGDDFGSEEDYVRNYVDLKMISGKTHKGNSRMTVH